MVNLYLLYMAIVLHNRAEQIGKVLFLTLLITIFRFPMQYSYNETDVLPYAYSVFNSSWLSSDWYLSTKIEYRFVFSYLLGSLIHWLGFAKATIVARVISYVVFTMSILALLKSLRIGFIYGCLALALFLLLGQHVAAGEWMVGGIETKSFAFSFVLLSLASAIKKRLTPSLVFAGLALSFHLLIGLYHLLFVSVFYLNILRNQKSSFKSYLIYFMAFSLPGSIGILAVLKYVFSSSSAPTFVVDPWLTYVQIRVPHHTLPNWEASQYAFYAILVILIFILALLSRQKSRKATANYALLSFVPFLVGIILFNLDRVALMRFYWFRMADTIPLLVCCLLVFGFIQNVLKHFSMQKKLRILLPVSLILGLAYVLIFNQDGIKELKTEWGTYSLHSFENAKNPDSALMEWIRDNTGPESCFLIPLEMENFYIYAQRPIYIGFKHSPQKADDLDEWYRRMLLLNSNQAIRKTGFNVCGEVNKSIRDMSEEQLKELGVSEGIDFVLLPLKTSKGLPLIFSGDRYNLYSISF